MNSKTLKKGCIVALIAYVVIAVLFYLIGGQQLRYRVIQKEMLNPSAVIGEITSDQVIEQPLSMEGDLLTELSLMAGTYQRTNTGVLRLEVLSTEGEVLATRDVDVSTLEDNAVFTVPFSPGVSIPGNRFVLRISAPEASAGNAIALYTGNTISASRYEVAAPIGEQDKMKLNGVAQEYMLCVDMTSCEVLAFGQYYWQIVSVVFVVLALVCVILYRKNERGQSSQILNIFIAMDRYHYLIKQLVGRDFKTKYKRSVLGIFWSFLNPLLTMLVQYIVFSTLFKSDIPNFALYLLIGIVCFNFFGEATNMSLMSIVGNTSLITKVYVPKYIYPLTRVMSSTINFLLALIPLFFVMLATGEPIRASILLLPLGIICLFCIALGIGMFLSSAMVFFRDTQFLWNVVSMLWMYATPIFYPESIIPAQFMTLYKMNPLYHVIRFIRSILIDGVSPDPKAYGLMILVSFIPLILGAVVFKKTQDKFVLNL